MTNIEKQPKMIRIKPFFSRESLDKPDLFLYGELEAFFSKIDSRWLKGKRIGITVGSRGIDRIAKLVKATVNAIKAYGGLPLIVPAMGSHGKAYQNGQELEILGYLGITQDTVGAPIIDCQETFLMGNTPNDLPVFVNRIAQELDGWIIMNRIKPHTDFSGSIESGLCKMIAIGLGSYEGANMIHKTAIRRGYEEVIVETSQFVLEKLPVIACVGLVENGIGEIAEIEVFSKDKSLEKEKLLLLKAKSMTAKLPSENIDILIVDEIGKEISGTGMDTKVIGRIMVKGQKEPESPLIGRIVVLDLTEGSHGNATGVGLADIITRRVFNKIDIKATTLNSITSSSPEQGKIPVVVSTDMDALDVAARTLGIELEDARIIHIKNTKNLDEMEVSAPLLKEIRQDQAVTIVGGMRPLPFDSFGALKRI